MCTSARFFLQQGIRAARCPWNGRVLELRGREGRVKVANLYKLKRGVGVPPPEHHGVELQRHRQHAVAAIVDVLSCRHNRQSMRGVVRSCTNQVDTARRANSPLGWKTVLLLECLEQLAQARGLERARGSRIIGDGMEGQLLRGHDPLGDRMQGR
jgi:hypothetical protein